MLKWFINILLLCVIAVLLYFARTSILVNLPNPIKPLSLGQTYKIAVIGDFGNDTPAEKSVADLVNTWQVDAVITTGDDNYDNGSATTIDRNIGKYYHQYIANYQGQFGSGSAQNKFFPALGNHDWEANGAQPYLNYFTLPGNERYYTATVGPVELFAVDSDPHEPDGIDEDGTQARWLAQELGQSKAAWQIVYFHHPPYSSGNHHGSTIKMRWPFVQWGVDMVLSGHEHNYERLEVNGIPYIVNGLGGNQRYGFDDDVLKESKVRYNDNWGAQLITVNNCELKSQFYAIDNSSPIDEIIEKNPQCEIK